MGIKIWVEQDYTNSLELRWFHYELQMLDMELQDLVFFLLGFHQTLCRHVSILPLWMGYLTFLLSFNFTYLFNFMRAHSQDTALCFRRLRSVRCKFKWNKDTNFWGREGKKSTMRAIDSTNRQTDDSIVVTLKRVENQHQRQTAWQGLWKEWPRCPWCSRGLFAENGGGFKAGSYSQCL